MLLPGLGSCRRRRYYAASKPVLRNAGRYGPERYHYALLYRDAVSRPGYYPHYLLHVLLLSMVHYWELGDIMHSRHFCAMCGTDKCCFRWVLDAT
eukprot:2511976-Rhodomonas_salina.5